jgi:hypothetical protein
MTAWGMPWLSQFPGGQAGALVQGPGFIHPDMDIDPLVVGRVDRGRGRTVLDGGQPAGVAVGQDVDGRPIFALADGLDEAQAVTADQAAVFGFFLGDGTGGLPGGFQLLIVRPGMDGGQDALHGPLQVDRRGAGGFDALTFGR